MISGARCVRINNTRFNMFRKLLVCGLLCAAIVGLPSQGAGGSIVKEGSFTIAAADTSFSEPVALTAASAEITRIVILNDGVVTGAVVVSALDLGVKTQVDSFALGATNGLCQYPPGRAAVTYDQTYVVTGSVAYAKQTAATNYVPIPVRDLVLDGYKATNGTDCVYWYRIYAEDR